jgi:REP element-mobilizing transposase RayT
MRPAEVKAGSWFDSLLDAGHGASVLQGQAASIVQAVLQHDDGTAYRLLAWCVMPNHVHVLMEQIEGYGLSDIVQTWKSVSARRVNALLGRKGVLWRREYFDRFMRDQAQFEATIVYVGNNPVAAGLALRPQDWAWSSARLRR